MSESEEATLRQTHARPLVSSLPDAEVAPEAYEPRRRRPVEASRRSVLKGAATVVAGAALGALDLLPFTRPAKAAAYTYWNDCRGYHDDDTTCIPTDAYYGADNCNGTWHKETTETFGSCLETQYTLDPSSCDGRNAWRWYAGNKYTMCSDGWKYARDLCNGGAVVLNSWSICRTTGSEAE